MAELRARFALGKRAAENERVLRRLLHARDRHFDHLPQIGRA